MSIPSRVIIEKPGGRLALGALGGVVSDSGSERFRDPEDLEGVCETADVDGRFSCGGDAIWLGTGTGT